MYGKTNFSFMGDDASTIKTINGKTYREVVKEYNRLLVTVPSNVLIAAFVLPGLTPSAKYILMCLCAHQGKKAYTCVTTKYMAVELCVSKRTIDRGLRALESAGLVKSYWRSNPVDGRMQMHRRVEIEALVGHSGKTVKK